MADRVNLNWDGTPRALKLHFPAYRDSHSWHRCYAQTWLSTYAYIKATCIFWFPTLSVQVQHNLNITCSRMHMRYSPQTSSKCRVFCAVSFAIGASDPTRKKKTCEQIAWLLASRVIQICVILLHTTARFFGVALVVAPKVYFCAIVRCVTWIVLASLLIENCRNMLARIKFLENLRVRWACETMNF